MFSSAYRSPFQSAFMSIGAANPLASAPQIAHWKFNGDANDSIGSNHLTEYNSPTYAAGKLNNAIVLASASSQYASIPDNASLSTGDVDFYIAVWAYPTSFSDYKTIASKGIGNANSEWMLLTIVTPDQRALFSVFKSGVGQTDVVASTFGALSLNTWYFIEAYHDSVNNQIGIAVNGGAFDTTSYSGGVNDSTMSFNVGALWSGSGALDYKGDFYIDSLRFFKGSGAILTSAQRAYLYNSGSGRED